MMITIITAILLLVPMSVSAQPAPPLTNVQIIGVTSDGEGYVWENIAFAQTVASVPLSGTTGYLAIYVEGTQLGSFPAIRNGGTVIPTFQALPDDFVTDSSGMVVGAIQYRGFDLADVSTGQFSATSINYYPPNQSITDFLYITVN